MAYLIDVISAERERWALWIPVLFGTGIGAYFSMHTEPPVLLLPCLIGVSGSLWLIGYAWRRSDLARSAMAIGLIAAIISVGAAVAQWRTLSMNTLMLEKRIGPTSVTGQITRLESFPDSQRVVLERLRIGGLANHQTPARIRVRIRANVNKIEPGDWVDLRAILSPPSPPVAPGAFDFQRHAYFLGIGAVGFSLGEVQITARANNSPGIHLRLFIASIRAAVTGRILETLPNSRGGVAAALITGERSAVPEDVMNAIRDSGLAHLLAISGLHIGLVAGIIFAVLRACLALIPAVALRFSVKKWAALVAIFGAFGYAILAGATLPTQRAFLMIGLALLGVILDRRGLSLRSVAWAAMVILAIQPESLLGPSFQMSFAAVIALIAGYEYLAERRRFDHHANGHGNFGRLAGRYLAGIALTTLIAGAATAPFAVYHFNRIADYGVIANLLAVPATGLWVMPWAIGALLLMPFGFEGLALIPMAWGIDFIIRVAETVAGWPGAVTIVPAMPIWGIVAVSIGGLWICLWRRSWRLTGSVGIFAGLIALAIVQQPDILIDGKGRILAIRDQFNNLIVSTPRGARFQREIWARLLGGDQTSDVLPVNGARLGGRLNCDTHGCILRRNGLTTTFVRDESAALDDCGHVDLIVSLIPLRGKCHSTHVVDRFDLWRYGAHAIWMDEIGIIVQTVAETRGKRPWVPRIPLPTKAPQSGS